VKDVQQLIRPEIRAIEGYHVPENTGLIKLDAMENPYSWPDDLIQLWLLEMQSAAHDINRYPDPQAKGVKARLREVMSIPEHLEIILGNGSDELIQLLAMAVATPDSSIVAPVPSFVMYELIARFAGMKFCGVDLDADFDLNVDAIMQTLADTDPALLFLALPNNPTGNLFSEDRLRRVITAFPGIVVLDEAYTPFTDADYLPWVDEYPNVVVMRTLSKVGLAGLRLGILIGQPELLFEIDKLRLPYNVNVLTQCSAEFALRHFSVFSGQADEIRSSRRRLLSELQGIPGLQVWPSEANFLLVTCLKGRATDLFEQLKTRGLLVKSLHGAHPRLDNCLRFTVGTVEQNQRLVAELTDLLV
jgi:histidinol-phosphate aminotransferase